MTDPVRVDGQIAIIAGAAAIGTTPLWQSAESDARIVAADVIRPHHLNGSRAIAAARPLTHFNS